MLVTRRSSESKSVMHSGSDFVDILDKKLFTPFGRRAFLVIVWEQNTSETCHVDAELPHWGAAVFFQF